MTQSFSSLCPRRRLPSQRDLLPSHGRTPSRAPRRGERINQPQHGGCWSCATPPAPRQQGAVARRGPHRRPQRLPMGPTSGDPAKGQGSGTPRFRPRQCPCQSCRPINGGEPVAASLEIGVPRDRPRQRPCHRPVSVSAAVTPSTAKSATITWTPSSSAPRHNERQSRPWHGRGCCRSRATPSAPCQQESVGCLPLAVASSLAVDCHSPPSLC